MGWGLKKEGNNMAFYGKNVGVVPLTDAAGITKVFNWPSHKGLDIGWYTTQYCPVLAWQDGFVVDKGYGSEVGNYIVVEHSYGDGDGKRWTGYIHLADTPSLKKGDRVTLGKQMGNARRGNTGVSNGVHLHLYLTSIVPVKTLYTWNTMLENCIDPKPYLYWSKEFNTQFISTAWTKELKKIAYPQPVARNEKVHQCEIKSDTRRLRMSPSINGTAYDDYCVKGIYNVYDMKEADGYTWALIAEIDGNKFWAAIMSGEDLPAKVIIYPEPVERDETKYQVDIKSDTRKLRAQPSLQGEAYDEMCKRGIYDALKWETADGHDWALIAVIDENEFWVAVMDGEDLPIADYKKLYEEEKKLYEEEKKKVAQLELENKEISDNLRLINIQYDELKSEVDKLKVEILALNSNMQALEQERNEAIKANEKNLDKLRRIKEIVEE